MAKRSKKGQGGARWDEQRQLWVGTVERGVDETTGKRIRQRVYAKTQRAMLAQLRRAQRDHDEGVPATPQQLTTRDWLEQWVRDFAPLTAKASTVATYTRVVQDWVLPHIGRTPLVKFQTDHWYRLNRILTEQGLAAGSRAKVRTVLHTAFAVAMAEGKLARNVMGLTKAIPMDHRTSDAMTAAQARKVMVHAHATSDPLEALAVLLLTMGLRQAEALDARWSDVDLDAALLRIPASKTKAGVRSLPLPAVVIDALKRHWARQMDDQLGADVWGDPDLIFTTSIGTRIDRRNCLRWWHDLTEGAGVGRRRMHAARHTAATVMLNAQPPIPLETISKILGHSRLAITSDIYAKPNAETLRGAADAIDLLYLDTDQ